MIHRITMHKLPLDLLSITYYDRYLLHNTSCALVDLALAPEEI